MEVLDEISVAEVRELVKVREEGYGFLDVSGIECHFDWSAETAQITHLYVPPQYRNQGIGTAVLRAVLAELRTVSVRPQSVEIALPLTDDQYDGATEHLLRKCGFEISYHVTDSPYPQRRVRGERSLSGRESCCIETTGLGL